MGFQVLTTFSQGFYIFNTEIFLFYSPVEFQGTNGGNEHCSIGIQTCLTALDMDEFFGTKICCKSSFGDHIGCQFQSHLRRPDTVASVGDVSKRAAMDHHRSMFRGLNQIRLQGILEDHAKGSDAIEFSCKNRFPGTVVTDHNPSKPLPKIFHILGQGHDRHHLGSRNDIETGGMGESIKFGTQSCFTISQLTVADIKGSAPGHTIRVEVQRVIEMHRIVHHGREQIVSSRNGVQISGEVHVDVFHWQHLRVTPSCCTSLDAEGWPHAGFPESQGVFNTKFPECLGQSDGGACFPFSSRSRSHGRDQNQFAVWAILDPFPGLVLKFCFVFSVNFQILFIQVQLGSYILDRFHLCLLGDFNIRRNVWQRLITFGVICLVHNDLWAESFLIKSALNGADSKSSQ